MSFPFPLVIFGSDRIMLQNKKSDRYDVLPVHMRHALYALTTYKKLLILVSELACCTLSHVILCCRRQQWERHAGLKSSATECAPSSPKLSPPRPDAYETDVPTDSDLSSV